MSLLEILDSMSYGQTNYTSVDSTAIVDENGANGKKKKEMQEAMTKLGYELGDMNINSWALRKEGPANIVWISDQDISQLEEGSLVASRILCKL